MNQTDTSFIKRRDERRSWHGETGEAEEEKKGRPQFFFFLLAPVVRRPLPRVCQSVRGGVCLSSLHREEKTDTGGICESLSPAHPVTLRN